MVQFSGDRYVPKMNVSAKADRVYCEEKGLLQTQSYDEWIIDPPTPAEIAGRAKIDKAFQQGAEEWADAMVEYALSEERKYETGKAGGKVILFPSPLGGARYCANDSDGRHIMPPDARANALYCDQACKKAAYRFRTAIGKS